ncbi:MAG: hypothetical protein CVU77_06435 [Elusimicrobia bacterium HGW-Elusimicrobia-1]|nr:MAG: hypothetical protein CVU77_06435 [Elusimicrobia bacterium HGW-Elusimicrobia-1]
MGKSLPSQIPPHSPFNKEGQARDFLQSPEKQVKVKKYEHQIDQMVYKLYDITEDEKNCSRIKYVLWAIIGKQEKKKS